MSQDQTKQNKAAQQDMLSGTKNAATNLDESADISFTEDEPIAAGNTFRIPDVTEPYNEPAESYSDEDSRTEAAIPNPSKPEPEASKPSEYLKEEHPSQPESMESGFQADPSPAAVSGEVDFKKSKENPKSLHRADPKSGSGLRDSKEKAELGHSKELAKIEEVVEPSLSSMDQSRLLDTSGMQEERQPAAVQLPGAEVGSPAQISESPAAPEELGEEISRHDDTTVFFQSALDFGISLEHRDEQPDESLMRDAQDNYGSVLAKLDLNSGDKLREIEATLKSSPEMLFIDQDLSRLPESKELAEDFLPLKHLLEHAEYQDSGHNFVLGDFYAILLSKSKNQLHVHHIEGKAKPFVLFNKKAALVHEICLVKEVAPKISIAIISFEVQGKQFVTAKGIFEEQFSSFDCKLTMEVPCKPTLFRSRTPWAGFSFLAMEDEQPCPKVVLLQVQEGAVKQLVGMEPNLLIPLLTFSIVDLYTDFKLGPLIDLSISTKDSLSVVVASKFETSPTTSGRMIVFSTSKGPVELDLFPYKDNQDEDDAVVMVEFPKPKFGTCSQECLIAIEDETGYIFSIKNRALESFRVELLQRFSIISGVTGPNSQLLSRSEIFLLQNHLIIFRLSAYWMLVFKLEEEVQRTGIGYYKAQGQARFKTNLTYCGYSIHQTHMKHAICVGRPFPEHGGCHLIQNLVGLSKPTIYSSIVDTTPNMPADLPSQKANPKINLPEKKPEKVQEKAPELEIEVQKSSANLIQNSDQAASLESQKQAEPVRLASSPKPEGVLSVDALVNQAMTGEQFFSTLYQQESGTIKIQESQPSKAEPEHFEVVKGDVVLNQMKSNDSSGSQGGAIGGQGTQEVAKTANIPEVEEISDKAAPSGETGPVFLSTGSNQLSGGKKSQDTSSHSQGKHQPAKKPEDSKPAPKSKEALQKNSAYNSKTTSYTGYKPKNDPSVSGNSSSYVPVNSGKSTAGAPTKAAAGKTKQTAIEDKDVREKDSKDFKNPKQRSRTPPRKHYGNRGTSTSSEETYEPKHPQNHGSQTTVGQTDGVMTFGPKTDDDPRQKDNNKLQTSNQFQEAARPSTPAFNGSSPGDFGQQFRQLFSNEQEVPEQLLNAMEKAFRKALSSFPAESFRSHSGHSDRSFMPDNFTSILKETIERVCEDKLINSMKTKFECLLSNNFNEAFEELVIPIFEKYLSKVFDKTGQIMEKGVRFYTDKINLEERKVTQFKDQFNQMTTQFLNQSKTFNKLCQDMSQTKKELETVQSKDLSKRVSALEDSVEKMKEKQDAMLEILMRIDQRGKQQEEDRKAEAALASTQFVTNANQQSSPQSSAQSSNPNHLPAYQQNQASAINLIQRPQGNGNNSPSANPSNEQLTALLNALVNNQPQSRPQQPSSQPSIQSLLPQSQGAFLSNQLGAFGPGQGLISSQQPQAYLQHQGNGISAQALQQFMNSQSNIGGQQPATSSTPLQNSSYYSPRPNSGMDSPMSHSMVINSPNGGMYTADRSVNFSVR